MAFREDDSPAAPLPAYKYTPLPGPRCIRILVVESAAKNAPLQCQLRTVSLDHTSWYTALSYSWGMNDDGDASLSREILIGDRSLRVTRNLYEGLLRIRAHYRKRWSRASGVALEIWVDAACINQEDPRERGSQVAMMADIYARAGRLVIWLGEGRNDKEAMRALKSIRASKLGHHAKIWQTREEPIKSLLTRRYFQRRWILQEIFHSNPDQSRVFWGPYHLELTRLRDILQIIEDSYTGQTMYTEEHPRMEAWDFDRPRKLLSMSITGLDLRTLLLTAQNMNCSDERDIVYSMLSVLATDIRPDYTKTVAQAFTSLARMLVENGYLYTLFHNLNQRRQCLQDSSTLPSWVPNFAEHIAYVYLEPLPHDADHNTGHQECPPEREDTLVHCPYHLGTLNLQTDELGFLAFPQAWEGAYTKRRIYDISPIGTEQVWTLAIRHDLNVQDGDLLCLNRKYYADQNNYGNLHVLRPCHGEPGYYEVGTVFDIFSWPALVCEDRHVVFWDYESPIWQVVPTLQRTKFLVK